MLRIADDASQIRLPATHGIAEAAVPATQVDDCAAHLGRATDGCDHAADGCDHSVGQIEGRDAGSEFWL